MPDTSEPEFDAIIVGAGINGLSLLHRLRDELDLSVRVFEAGADLGGTWFFNRYPGARLDSESFTYGYLFSEEIFRGWDWPERYASQTDVERYLHYAAELLDLRRSIDFNAKVASAAYLAEENLWAVILASGQAVRCRYLITALGTESVPYLPEGLVGLETFEGVWHHTASWPQEPVDFTGKRVAVMGTGSSGVQVITEVAKSAAQLTVLQRSPNYCAPLRNSVLSAEEQAELDDRRLAIADLCNRSYVGFAYEWDSRSGLDLTAEQRREVYEQLWQRPGFAKWHAGFSEVYSDAAINEEYGAFVREKIRERVSDPVVAERLTPTYAFSTRRVPMDSGYYEVYNQDNVELIDIKATPIDRFVPAGAIIDGRLHEFDIIVFATGFDAFTGAFNKIDITGLDGLKLTEHWGDGPRTLLGIAVHKFPNFLMLTGPHNKGVFCNVPICGEQNIRWVTDLLSHLRESGYSYLEATAEAEQEWGEHVIELYEKTMLARSGTESYFTGVNVPGKKVTAYGYFGSLPQYAARCDEVAEAAYKEHFVVR
ncbi:NAD(P)/FAD-dependent oxidoreductase [Jatrophihabitans sp.]|uniref:flavin-containing monooxygenase n=1 Tax=Jatrophihabitans sp. TaxID=1932789 RepID=UPI0030C6B9AA|nr:cyclohexanone monooxygenase [Jatrophihabitans sp.]